MTEHRWSKFWWQDYEADMALRLVSLSAQGLWMRMLCVMHRGTPYGHLTLNSKPMTTGGLSRLVGVSERVGKGLLAELEAENVFSRTEEGVIYCRRMVRDKEFSNGMKEIGKSGGNPDIIRGTVPKEDRIRGYKRSDSPRKTERIFERTNGQCFWCDVPLQRERPGADFFQVDHVVAVRDGGTNDEDNLVASCSACNHKRARHQSDPNHPTITGMKSDPKHLEAEADTEAESKKKEPPQTSFEPPQPVASPAAPPPRQPNGTRLPDEWQPDEPAFAGCGPNTLAKFRDYWRAQPGAKGRKTDWQATWRNWCRREAEQPKPKLHTLSPAEQDRRILAAVGLNFDDPQHNTPPMRIAQ